MVEDLEKSFFFFDKSNSYSLVMHGRCDEGVESASKMRETSPHQRCGKEWPVSASKMRESSPHLGWPLLRPSPRGGGGPFFFFCKSPSVRTEANPPTRTDRCRMSRRICWCHRSASVLARPEWSLGHDLTPRSSCRIARRICRWYRSVSSKPREGPA